MRPWPTAFLAFALLAGPARAASPAHALATLEREWAAHVVAQRPDEAERLGLRVRDDALVPVTESWLAAEDAWLADFAARLATVPAAGLAPRGVARRDSMARLVAGWRDAQDVRRVWRREPAAYAALAGDAVEATLARGNPCERAQRAARRLGLVPEVLRAARVNLRETTPVTVEAGLGSFARVLDLYRTTIPARVDACRDGEALARLAEADTAAVRAVESFLVFLREDVRTHASVDR